MKRILTLAIVALFTLNLSAQKIEKGIWQIEIGTGIMAEFNFVTGGSTDIDITNNGTSDVGYPISGDWSDLYNAETDLKYGLDFTNFDNWEERFLTDLSFGYFVADGFLIGLRLNLGGLNTNDDDTLSVAKFDNIELGATPKLRYYIETGRGNAMFFESSLGLNLSNTTTRVDDVITKDWYENKTNQFGTTIGLGFGWSLFNFNSREIFSVEPMFGFNIHSGTTTTTGTVYTEGSTGISSNERIVKTVLKGTSMEPYFKLKVAFYLGRHFWSH